VQVFRERREEGLTMNWGHKAIPPLSEAQFLLWQVLLEDRTGMYLPVERKSLLQSNLSIRMREINCSDYDEYYAQIFATPSGVLEWSILVDRLMVQETRFCRNVDSLDLLERFLRHRILNKKQNAAISIWSVGCCTGEEPYTLAMVCYEAFLKSDRAPVFGVSGTDISLPAIQKARAGIYRKRQLSNIKQEWMGRYFDQSAGDLSTDDLFSVKDLIKQHVCFSMSNIVDTDKSPLKNVDVIYCQNVLLYFRVERKHRILNSLSERLAPGGMLVIGQGETNNWRNPLMQRVEDNRTLAFVRRENPLNKQTTH